MENRAGKGVLPVRVEKWGATEVRIATVLPRLTKNSDPSWHMPPATYPESDYRTQTKPSAESPVDTSLVKVTGGVTMGQGIEYRPQSLQRAVGFST